jgi:RHS repeat-associated protein
VTSGNGTTGNFSGVNVKIQDVILREVHGEEGQVIGRVCATCGGVDSPSAGHNSHSIVSAQYDVASVDFKLPIGRPILTATNSAVGSLYIHEELPCNELFTPFCLKLTPSDNYEDVVKDSNGWIRQVKGVEGLVDVISGGANSYEIKVYGRSNVLGKSGGLWTTANAPSASFKLEKIGSNNEVRITATQSGGTRTNQFSWISTNSAWSLNRSDTRWDVMTLGTNAGQHTVTRSVRSAIGGTNIASVEARYSDLGWGNVAVEQRIGGTGGAGVASVEFVTATNAVGYQMPKKISDTWGNWVWADYDSSGRLVELRKGFGNQGYTTDPSLCASESFSYGLLSGAGDTGIRPEVPRTEVRSIFGREIGRTYRVFKSGEMREIVCGTPGAAWTASDNLVSITTYYTNGTFATLPKTKLTADGLLSVYEYSSGSAYRTNTVWHGQPNTTNSAVIAGTKSVTIVGSAGYEVSTATYDVASGIQLSGITFGDFDEFGRARRRTYLDGTFVDVTYGCCGIESETDREGVVTTYEHDSAGRVVGRTRNGITEATDYNAAGLVVQTRRIGTDASVAGTTLAGYDTSGRLIASTNALGGVTLVAYSTNSAGQAVVTTTAPDEGTRIETAYLDGTVYSITGTAVAPVRYEKGVEQESGVWRRISVEVRLGAGTSDTNEWTKTFYDMLDRPYRTEYATGTTNKVYRQTWYDSKGRPWKDRDPDGVITLREYNGLGEILHTAVDVDQDNTIDLAGPDRVVRMERDVLTLNSIPVQRTRQWVYANSTNNTTLLTREDWVSTDGLKSGSTAFGQTQSAQTVIVRTNQTRMVTSTLSDGGTNLVVSVSGRVASVVRYAANGTVVATSTHGYDAHGRQAIVTDGRNGSSSMTYNVADLVVSSTSAAPGNGQSALTGTTEYDTSLRAWRTTQPDGTTVVNEFYVTGALKKTSGSRTYPVEYTYDTQGRMKTLKTWQNFSGNSGTAITTWSYDPYRGWLVAKDYANASTGAAGTVGTDYTYTDGGRLRTRTWARTYNGSTRIATTYSYGFNDGSGGNEHGDLVSVSYNDGSTPTSTFSYDRLGRQTTIARNGMTTTRQYHDSGISIGESHSGGELGGVVLTNLLDSNLRRSGLVLKNGGSTILTNGFTFDGASRMTSVTDGSALVSYAYSPLSSLIESVTSQYNGVTRMTTARVYDRLGRLQSISSTPAAAGELPISSAYQYNDAGQRIRSTQADGTYWLYSYDALGQVTSGNRYMADGSPIAGQQFSYGYDDIGNRTQAGSGGDGDGANLRTESYARNYLNQYSARTNHRYLEVAGIATPGGTVTVNGTTALRQGGRFRSEWSVAGTAAAWQNVDVLLSAGEVVPDRKLYLPPQSEGYSHDLDGNLTGDGRWTYTWDGENRLMSASTASGAYSAGVPGRKVEYTYDWTGRMIRRVGYSGNPLTPSWTLTDDTRFAYDGWLCRWESMTNSSAASRPWVTSIRPSTTVRSDYSGWVGMRILTGDSPVWVTRLGRWVLSGNSGSHTVKLVTASTGVDVSGGSVSVNTSGASTNRFLYTDLASPIQLAANTAYYLVSLETNGGDRWYQNDTMLSPEPGLTVTHAAHGSGGSYWTSASPNNSYGPVSLVGVATTESRTQLWGLDLSGGEQGVGGVGGLLGTRTGTAATRFMAYDGNGNITGVVNGGTGRIAATMVYSPFGEMIAREGDAERDRYGFSTKWGDGDTGTQYYGYRFYFAEMGRWLGRDPLLEHGFSGIARRWGGRGRGSISVEAISDLSYGMAFNDPIARIDVLGLAVPSVEGLIMQSGFLSSGDSCGCPMTVCEAMARFLEALGNATTSFSEFQRYLWTREYAIKAGDSFAAHYKTISSCDDKLDFGPRCCHGFVSSVWRNGTDNLRHYAGGLAWGLVGSEKQAIKDEGEANDSSGIRRAENLAEVEADHLTTAAVLSIPGGLPWSEMRRLIVSEWRGKFCR